MHNPTLVTLLIQIQVTNPPLEWHHTVAVAIAHPLHPTIATQQPIHPHTSTVIQQKNTTILTQSGPAQSQKTEIVCIQDQQRQVYKLSHSQSGIA